MNEDQARTKIMAAAYAAAADLGTNKAVELLKAAIHRLEQDQWSAPGDR